MDENLIAAEIDHLWNVGIRTDIELNVQKVCGVNKTL